MGTGPVQNPPNSSVKWVLQYDAQPWTLNQERGRGGKASQKGSGHWSQFSGEKAQWRRDFMILAKQAKIPPCHAIRVEVRQYCPTEVMPDPGNIFPAVKAAIDGIVDAKVIPKDTRAFVHYIGFHAPVRGTRHSVVLEVEGWPIG